MAITEEPIISRLDRLDTMVSLLFINLTISCKFMFGWFVGLSLIIDKIYIYIYLLDILK